nr:hypothetical protein [Tanacetum cinerariifolium]
MINRSVAAFSVRKSQRHTDVVKFPLMPPTMPVSSRTRPRNLFDHAHRECRLSTSRKIADTTRNDSQITLSEILTALHS